VFQVLPHTLGVGPEVWRILDKCHRIRNLAEYEGYLDFDVQLLNELLLAAQGMLDKLSKLDLKKR
jgi:hypothetical protein